MDSRESEEVWIYRQSFLEAPSNSKNTEQAGTMASLNNGINNTYTDNNTVSMPSTTPVQNGHNTITYECESQANKHDKLDCQSLLKKEDAVISCHHVSYTVQQTDKCCGMPKTKEILKDIRCV